MKEEFVFCLKARMKCATLHCVRVYGIGLLVQTSVGGLAVASGGAGASGLGRSVSITGGVEGCSGSGSVILATAGGTY